MAIFATQDMKLRHTGESRCPAANALDSGLRRNDDAVAANIVDSGLVVTPAKAGAE
jgi:hypothetical protein